MREAANFLSNPGINNLRTRQGGFPEKEMTTINTHFGASIECQISAGIGIHVIGVPDNQTRGMLLCVVTYLRSIGYSFPGKKVVINVVGMGEHKWQDLVFYIGCAILKESGNLVL